MIRHPRTVVAALAAVTAAALCTPRPSQASWPMARHDAARTGAATGKSDLVAPTAYWRTYLGGSLRDTQFASIDADGDGSNDLVYASGGRIVAKKQTDQGLWQTKPRGVGTLSAIADVDGDGVQDLITSNSNHLVIVKSTTGEIEWTEPDGEMGTLGGVRVGDLDGDGKAEVAITECGCCGVNSGKSGFVYSFGAGFKAPKLLYSTSFAVCGQGASESLVDVDGDGRQELLLGASDHFELFDGKTGASLGVSPALSGWTSVSQCKSQDLDGAPGEELVCILNESVAGNRRATALRYNPGAKALDVLWTRALAPASGGDVRWVDPVVDLDGDGKQEFIVSTTDGTPAGWTTHIFDALTGAELVAPVTSQYIVGTAETTTKGRPTLFTSDAGTLHAYRFSRLPAAALVQDWQLANRRLLTSSRADRRARYAANASLVTADLDHDGLVELIAQPESDAGSLIAISASGGVPKEVGTRALPAGVEVQQAWSLGGAKPAEPELALARSDGYLELLDARLAVAQCCGEFPSQLVIRVGGYYAAGSWRELSNAPRTFPMKSGGADSIFVSDSRGALLRFDPKGASLVSPPAATWSVARTTAPTVAAGLDGADPGIACIANDNGPRVRVLHGDGTVRWDAPFFQRPMGDLAPGDFDGDGVPDLVAQWGAPSDVVLHTRALAGKDGATLWDAAPVSPGAGRQPAGVAVGKWDGDALDDVLQQGPSTYVLSGANGVKTASGGTGDAYFMPILTDTTGDGVPEVVLHAGYSPVRLYSHDLQSALYTSQDDDRPYPYGAIATCGADKVLVEGSSQHPSRLKFTPLSGPSLGVAKTVVLASGGQYTDETAAAAVFQGQLTAVAVHENLTGKGHPTAVVGSQDGFVYGLDPCSKTLDFAVDLHVATGEVVFGDTDGDGRDEVLVTAADGFLYNLKNKAIDAPTAVIDTDPAHGVLTTDVDAIDAFDTLSGAWKPVTGATGYSVAVVDDNGKLLSSPPWQDVGVQTSASVKGLPLATGKRYTFAVRANSASGPSVDAASNGVKIIAPALDGGAPSPDSGGGVDGGAEPAASASGCGCAVARGASASAFGLCCAGLALGLVMARRRRG